MARPKKIVNKSVASEKVAATNISEEIKPKKRIFLCQPMRGIEPAIIEYNIKRLNDLCSLFSGLVQVDSFDPALAIKPLQQARKYSYHQLTSADVFVYAPYDSSLHPTCEKEMQLAIECGLPIFKLETFLNNFYLLQLEIFK
jgi:hypothetical protein